MRLGERYPRRPPRSWPGGARGLPRPQARAALWCRAERGGRLAAGGADFLRGRFGPRPGRLAGRAGDAGGRRGLGPAGSAMPRVRAWSRSRAARGSTWRRRASDQRPVPLVLLEDPRTMGNMGACVRVAAAADAAGVLTTGTNDPGIRRPCAAPPGSTSPCRWRRSGPCPRAIAPWSRSIPRARSWPPAPSRSALDPRLRHRALRPQRRAARRRRRPPRDPDARLDSSLNLATAVAAVLFSQRL